MKVLLINKFYYLKGGSERVFFDTKKILENNGHETCVFAMQDNKNINSKYEEFFVKNVSFKGFFNILKSFVNIYSLDAKYKLEKLIKKEKPDICHIHNDYYQISPSIFSVLKKYNIPVVKTVHDYHMVSPNYNLYCDNGVCYDTGIFKYFKMLMHLCIDQSFIKTVIAIKVFFYYKIFGFYNNISYFIVPSIFMYNKMIEAGYDSKKLIHITYPVDTDSFVPSKNPERKHILFYGRLEKNKGLEIFLDAIKNIKNIDMKIIGSGSLAYKAKIAARDNDNIEYIPHIDNKVDIIKIIQASYCVVVPSVWYEVFGLTATESLSCGIPVIASDIGALPEQVINDKTGYLFEAGNSRYLEQNLQFLLKYPEKLDKLSLNARAYAVDTHSFDIYYNKLEALYNRVIKNEKE